MINLARLMILGFWICLAWAGWAHGGEDHGDMREAPRAAAESTGPPKITAGQFDLGGKHYALKVQQAPAEPTLGQEVQLEFTLTQKLATPDPLLGSEMTVEGKQFHVAQTAPEAEDLGTTHVESPGTYGVHWTPHQAGRNQLQFTADGGLTFSLTVDVARPWRQKVSMGVAAVAVGLALLTTLLRRKLFGGLWVFTGVLCATALGIGFWPSTPPHSHAEVAQEHPREGLIVPVPMQRDLGMTVATATRRELAQTVRVPGQVRVPEGKSHTLHARFTSRILSDVPQVGRRVQAGETLALLEEVLSSNDRVSMRNQQVELAARQLEFATQQNGLRRQTAELQARRQVAGSERIQRARDLRRSEQLYAIQALPLKELQAARTALTESDQELAGLTRQLAVLRQAPTPPALPAPVGLQQYSLTSPVSGVISKVEAAAEEVVDPSKALFTVLDLSTVWVSARVSEADLGVVHQFGTARIFTPAYPESFSGRFVSLSPSLDPESRTAQVYFAVDNRAGKLLDGMSAEVEMRRAPQAVLAIPSEAVISQDEQSRVFLQVEPDRFVPRTVTVKRKLGNLSVIGSGLKASDRVVVSGVGTLMSELARKGGGQSHD